MAGKIVNKVLIMFVCALAISMMFAGGRCEAKKKIEFKYFGDYKYTVDSDGVTIEEYIGNAKKVVVPKKINGKKVVAIGQAAFVKIRRLNQWSFRKR